MSTHQTPHGPATIEGKLVGTGLRFGIVCGRFNENVTSKLLGGALDCLYRHGVDEAAVDVCWVPGSFEIPLTAQELALAGQYDAVICLGAVIRGATIHFELVAAETAKGVASVGLHQRVPCIFGVVTTDTLEQALERSGGKNGNKGWDAALSAIEMSNVMRAIRGAQKAGAART